MFDEYRCQVVNLRRAGQTLFACVQVLEETDLTGDASIARWLEELERAAAASGEALRQADELRTAIAGAWPRSREPAAHDGNTFG